MRKSMMLMLAGGLMLTACGDQADKASGDSAANAPAEKPQPGSWSQKIEVVELSGEGVPPGAKDQMNQMFAAASARNICLTPEAVAQQDFSKRMSELASQGSDCTFERQNVSGNSVDFAATCKGPGRQMKIAGEGTNGATSQDMTITINPLKPDGTSDGKMVMRVTTERTGECGPNDITPPTAPVGKS